MIANLQGDFFYWYYPKSLKMTKSLLNNIEAGECSMGDGAPKISHQQFRTKNIPPNIFCQHSLYHEKFRGTILQVQNNTLAKQHPSLVSVTAIVEDETECRLLQ